MKYPCRLEFMNFKPPNFLQYEGHALWRRKHIAHMISMEFDFLHSIFITEIQRCLGTGTECVSKWLKIHTESSYLLSTDRKEEQSKVSQVWFVIFIKGLDSRIENALIKFSDKKYPKNQGQEENKHSGRLECEMLIDWSNRMNQTWCKSIREGENSHICLQ